MMMDKMIRGRVIFAACAFVMACGGSDSPTGAQGTPNPVVAPQSQSVRPGTMLQYRVVNTGGGTVTWKPCVVAAQQLLGTTWNDLPLPSEWRNCTAASHHLTENGSEYAVILVPLSLVAGGVYRVALDMQADDGNGPQPITVYSTSFTVEARQ